MINGHVDENLQPKIPLALIDGNGQASAIEVVVDTGFNGHLRISVYAMHKIGLQFRRIEKFELGNGKIVKKLDIDYTNKRVLIKNSRRRKRKRI